MLALLDSHWLCWQTEGSAMYQRTGQAAIQTVHIQQVHQQHQTTAGFTAGETQQQEFSVKHQEPGGHQSQ